MLIHQAYAAEPAAPISGSDTQSSTGAAVTPPIDSTQAFMWNLGMVGLLVVMFYFLLILPQQRRFKEHSQMVSGLKKGDKIVTGGGLIGTIDKIDQSDEVIIDLGNGVKVTALRSSVQSKDNPLLRKKAANDAKDNKKK